MEAWPCVSREALDALRAQARAKYEEGRQRPVHIAGSDIDPEAVELARRHIRQAGLAGRIDVETRDMRDVALTGEPGVFIANPPYGERLGDLEQAGQLERTLAARLQENRVAGTYVITADADFEHNFGKKASRRRKLYNGMIPCQLYMYF